MAYRLIVKGETVMNNEKQKILDMVNEGKISAADGARLLECLNDTEKEEKLQVQESARRMKGKKLKVMVEGKEKGNPIKVNVSVPLVLARYADNILANCVPASVNDDLGKKGVDLKSLNISAIVDAFEDLEEDIVNVDIDQTEEDTKMQVRVYVE